MNERAAAGGQVSATSKGGMSETGARPATVEGDATPAAASPSTAALSSFKLRPEALS